MLLKKLLNISNIQIIGLSLILLFSVLHRGGATMQAHIVFALILSALSLLTIFDLYKKKSFSINLNDLLLLIFSGFFALSFLFSQTVNYGLTELVQVVGGTLIFFIVSKSFVDSKNIQKFVNIAIYIASLSTLIGFFAYLLRPFDRFVGTFQDFRDIFSVIPNGYADFILLLLPFIFYNFINSNNKKEKILSGSILAFNLIGFILSSSEGAFVAVAGMIILYLMFFFRKIWRSIISVFAVILISFLISFAFTSLHQQLFPETNLKGLDDKQVEKIEQSISTNERVQYWEASLKMLQDENYSWIFGFGPDSFKFVYPPYQSELLNGTIHPHNIFLKILLENGLICLASFVLILLSVCLPVFIVAAKDIFRKNKKIHELSILALISVAGIIAHHLIDYNLHLISNVILLWFFLGCIARNKSGNDMLGKFFAIFYILYSIFLLTWSFHDAYLNYFFKNARNFDLAEDNINANLSYQKSEDLLMKRDYYLSYAKFLIKSNEKENLKKAYDLLELSIQSNKFDSRVYDVFGLLYLNKNFQDYSIEKAENNFDLAIANDPKNNFEYYLNKILIIQKNNDYEKFKEEIYTMLNEYLNLLKINAHLTIITENPRYAISILNEILKKDNVTFCNENKFCILRAKLIEAKKNEEAKIEKFSSMKIQNLKDTLK